ncbi:MAG: DNA mismatch repair endonuclease MutL [Lachnospiraceae bacterium]|nr:DNA mismatch repair endonuclease MutL [Lachnospiraceae bacterium]
MNEIHVLDKHTIDKIAAGEVVERPLNVVKELMENSIDAGATMLSVEIRDGGISLIRITDNGSGIEKEQIRKAFLRHSTSKIRNAEDLSFVTSLGFRGEALSSIAAVSKVELCTKVNDSLTGTIFKMSGGEELSLEDAGLPDGTTVIVKDLFYNTPARLKFLKSAQTEAGYILDMVNKIALSHPDISIKFTSNGSVKLSTSGNGDLKDAIYAVFGREITSHLLPISRDSEDVCLSGYLAKPEVARANRNFELFFVNGRYVRDPIISSAIEEGYKGYQMKGSFPFTVLNIRIEPELMDVNVHPSKMEIRFFDNERVYSFIRDAVLSVLTERESIPSFTIGKDEKPKQENAYASNPISHPEPFETERIIRETTIYPEKNSVEISEPVFEQQTIHEVTFLSEDARKHHRLIGEIFDTYWLVEFDDSLYVIDQHAAHEKVLYESFMHRLKKDEHYSQNLMPALIVTLSPAEETTLRKILMPLQEIGFEISHYGGSEYAISAVPADLYTMDESSLFLSFLDEMSTVKTNISSDVLQDRIATAACKAAVKGGNRLTFHEADQLIDQLLSLDNPYNCPHGRPTILTMSRYELERKFKRIVS